MTGKFLQHFTSLFSRGFSDKNKATSKALLRLRNAAFPLVSRTFFLPATSVNGNCACSIWTAHTNLCSQVQTLSAQQLYSNMALVRSLASARGKVSLLVLERINPLKLEFYLMNFPFIFQGVFSAICRNAFSTTARASATVSLYRSTS